MKAPRNCPRCKSPRVARERRPDGFTKCLDCGHQMHHAAWDSGAENEFGLPGAGWPPPFTPAPKPELGALLVDQRPSFAEATLEIYLWLRGRSVGATDAAKQAVTEAAALFDAIERHERGKP